MLASKSRDWQRSSKAPLALALTVSLCAQVLICGPAQALSFISAKKSQLQTPMEAKLDDDSGPSADTASGAAAEVTAASGESTEPKTDSKSSRETAKESKKEVAKQNAKETTKKDAPVSLAPVSLSDENAADSGSASSADASEKSDANAFAAPSDKSDKQYMKLHAETMGYSG